MKIIKKIEKIFEIIANPLSSAEHKLSNGGERLVPKHANNPEVIRHKSSYKFFKNIIEKDQLKLRRKIRIVDLGCGVGHGSKTLAELKNSDVTGVDISEEAIIYAENHFAAPNIKYVQSDLREFIKNMPQYDYVVSRGVFEHIRNGLNLIRSTKWRYRLIFDVPYNELPGPNQYHLITQITEKSFTKFNNPELFYQDLTGKIYNQTKKPKGPNMIICVESAKVKNVAQYLKFPVTAWKGKKVN